MQQLSGLDATFLHLETAEMPMHVGALHVFELPEGFKGRFVSALRQHVKERLPLMPALRRRLWQMPLKLANPAWVDAEPDLRRHIVEHRLPATARKGSGWAEMEALVAQLHAQRLDRDRPLWVFHVLEGLGPSPEGRRRVGLYTQLHHAAVDGQAAVALANVLLDTTPEGRELALRPSRRTKVFKLEMAEMLRGALANEAQQVARIVRDLPSTLSSLKDAAVQVLANTGVVAASALAGTAASSASTHGTSRRRRVSNLALAPRTPMNASITAERAFASVALPLPELKLLARAHDVTLNDLVLMLCASALRRYLARHKALPRKPLVAAVPVTLREQGDSSPDNQATMSLVTLGTHIADPGRRLAWIVGATTSMKSTMGSLKNVMPTDYPSIGVPWLMEAAVSLYGRMKVAERIPAVANVIISNVPGPAVPLYLAGARMLANRPASIVVHGCALNITVQSYDRTMEFGLVADPAAMPDLRLLADSVEVAMDELRALPLPETQRRRSMRRAVVETVGAAASGVARAAVKEAVQQAVGSRVGRQVAGAVAGTVGSLAKKVAGERGVVVPIKRVSRR